MTQPYQPYHSPKSGMNSKVIFGIIAGALAVLLCCCGGIGVYLWQSGIIEETIAQVEKDAAEPDPDDFEAIKAGDCLTSIEISGGLELRNCLEPDAIYKVSSVMDGKTERQGADECFKTGAPERLFFADGSAEGLGRTICLKLNRDNR